MTAAAPGERASGARELSPIALLAILGGLNLFNYFDRYILSAVLPYIQSDFRLGYGDAGRINTAFMIGYFVTSPLFGYFGDRGSRKWLIAIGIFVWSAGTVLSGFAPVFALLMLFRIFVGVGEASYASISPSLIGDSYDAKRRNMAMTIFYTAIPIGAALGNILGGVIAARAGWRVAFFWAGAPGLALAFCLLPFKDTPHSREALAGSSPSGDRVTPASVFRLFRLPNYTLTIAGYAAYTFVVGAFAVWGPSYLHKINGLGQEAAATFFGAVLVVCGLVSTLVGGLIATAWQRRTRSGYALMLALSVALAVPTSLVAFFSRNLALSMSAFGLSMFFLFLSTGPVNTLIVETVPGELRASAMALSIFAIHLFGDMWSPEIVGRISDYYGSLRKGVLILPMVLVLAAAAWGALAARMRRDRP
ncbi:MAG: spinster family MFS transporter [Rectinemataceae bacterium]